MCIYAVINLPPTNRIIMKSRDPCSLNSLYQEWEERQMAAMNSSTKSTSKTAKVKVYTSLVKCILSHDFPCKLLFLVIHLAEGYFDTYDLAKCDAEGNYQVTSRVDDAIRMKGVWLEVTKIESVMVRMNMWNIVMVRKCQ